MSSTSPALAPPKTDTSTAQKAWASQRMRGLANYVMPTFLDDGTTLDEEAIRLDVRHSVDHGFFSTIPLDLWSAPLDPLWEQFYKIMIDAAEGEILIQGAVFGGTVDEEIAIIQRLEALGVHFLALTPVHPASISGVDLFESYRRRLEATDLPCTIFASTHGRGFVFPDLGPTGQPLDVFDRLADVANVVGIKLSHPVPLMTQWQICERIADRVLVAPVNLDFVPVLGRQFNIQWSGQWNAEAVQTPGCQLAVEMLAATAARDFERAEKVSNQMHPALDLFYWLQAGSIAAGGHPWQHNKYYSWLGGGNGGVLPLDPSTPEEAIPTLDASTRQRMRAAFAATGLSTTDAPDEQFIVGRAAWERGVRPKDTANLSKFAL
jgi:4-hydroxy-tetrahydrodipicolinate synthase